MIVARGRSGRIVLEIDPELKRKLYLALEKKQQTMKKWFISEALSLIKTESKHTLFEEKDKKLRANTRNGKKK